MISKRERLKPAVGTNVLVLLSGLMWLGVVTLLLGLSHSWLSHSHDGHSHIVFIAPGMFLALLIRHFGFLRVADKNLDRIAPMEGKRCMFAFISWKSYATAAVMVCLGMLLRNSPIPKTYLSIVYIGIGLGLVLSSIRYIRVFLQYGRRDARAPNSVEASEDGYPSSGDVKPR